LNAKYFNKRRGMTNLSKDNSSARLALGENKRQAAPNLNLVLEKEIDKLIFRILILIG
jgi:hypothetical protein